MDDGLEQPVIEKGMMKPLTTSVGLGKLVDYEWITKQQVTDQLGALVQIPASCLK